MESPAKGGEFVLVRTRRRHRSWVTTGGLMAAASLLAFEMVGSTGKDVDAQGTISWITPGELEQARKAEPGSARAPVPALSTNYVQVQLLEVLADCEEKVGVFAPAATNACGLRARILSPEQVEKLRQSIYEPVLAAVTNRSSAPRFSTEEVLQQQVQKALLGVRRIYTTFVPPGGQQLYVGQAPPSDYSSRFAGPSCSLYPTNNIAVDLHPMPASHSFAAWLGVTSLDNLGPPLRIEGVGEIPTARTNAAFACRVCAPPGTGLILEIGRGKTVDGNHGIWLFVPFEMVEPKVKSGGR